MKKLLSQLIKYEKKHAPGLHKNNNVRFTQWYKLCLYTDGSGFIQDTYGMTLNNPQILFRFDSIDDLEKELKK